MLLRFLDTLSSFSASDVLFTLKDGNLGSEARSPNSMLWDLSKGLGPMVEAPAPRFDETPAVDPGLGHIGRFLEELAVVCETVFGLVLLSHQDSNALNADASTSFLNMSLLSTVSSSPQMFL